MIAQESSTSCESGVYELFSAMRRLDRLLDRAVSVAQAVYGPEALADPFRGLHISRQEVERLLGREPGIPLLWADGPEPETSSENGDYPSRMAWLQQVFGLSSFDINVLLIAFAPQLDLRYEKLYAYLQDDVSRRKPTVDLILNLLCLTAEDKLARRVHFSSDAPLIRHGILHLLPDPNQLQPPLLSEYLKVDEQIVNLLLFQDGLDTRLVPFCRMIRPRFGMEGLLLTDEKKCGLPSLVNTARKEQRPLRLYFHGPDENNKRNAAEAIAWESDMRLIVTDLARAVASGNDFAALLKVLFREAWFKNAILYLDGLDTLRREEYAISSGRFMEALSDGGGITILTGKGRWTPVENGPVGVFPVPFMHPDFAEKRACWTQHLAVNGTSMSETELDALSTRFRLMPHQIEDTIALAWNRAVWREAPSSHNEQPTVTEGRLTLDDLFAAAREQTGHELATLAVKIEPKYRWEDIVLPDDALAHLREVCLRVAYRHVVMDEWGFDRKLSQGKGVNALFAGPSGTGKTMAAEVIANELGLDLYKIDLAGVVSKYIGETEKNLDRIFTAAENANAILFFDEADALFGRRSEVRDSHDRYANIEISYLLQKMEQYEGITVLATNLRQNLDEAFVRRLAFTIHLPFPDEASRRRIWTVIWPAATQVSGDVDVDFLARQFKLSGGNIKNIALAASFMAAADGGAVAMEHLLHGTQREYQKMGKALSETELYGDWKSPREDGCGGH